MGRAGRIVAGLLPLTLALVPGTSTAEVATVALHGQATIVFQGVPDFRSSYVGPNSLIPGQRKETIDATLYVGARLWAGMEIWADPEIDQGFGLSNTLGAAGFPSAEAYKVGNRHPYLRLQRLFARETIDLGGEAHAIEGAANQMASRVADDRIVLTAGKFGVGDIFDTIAVAHDPRRDFLNWAAVDGGSFDYAADAWGYSSGIAAELYRGAWTLRLGLFNLSTIPNGEHLERGFGQYQLDGEIEHRHRIGGRPGRILLTMFRNRGRFGRFADALAISAGGVPDTADVRRARSRIGVHLGIEQEIGDGASLFARLGVADGAIEPYDFTDIDRTAALGASIAGDGWGRAHDRIGIVAIANAISSAHRRYLAAGGLGVLIGDGQLPDAGAELIGEAYYAAPLVTGVTLSLDYQLIGRPGYNRARGPANVLAMRLHGEF